MRTEPKLEFIGAGIDGPWRDAARILSALPNTDDVSELLIALDEYAAGVTSRLESCLTGHDSFDTLGFLRMTLDLFNRERTTSEVPLERGQSTQDAVALCLLGMGLPRKPLTGEVAGQPDLDNVLQAAADLLRAAALRAHLECLTEPRPLGTLAAEFKSYELFVRGRQFESVARVINQAVLDDPPVRQVLQSQLGFSLEDVRRVREAGGAHLTEHFFGARDRVGALALRDTDPNAVEIEALQQDMSLMLSECRRFASFEPYHLVSHSGLAEKTIERVLTTFSTARPAPEEPRPLDDLLAGRVQGPGGCIRDEDGFLLLNGFLSESELRREIERALSTADEGAKPWGAYLRKRAVAVEGMVADVLKGFLGVQPQWQSQKYWAPPEGTEATLLGNSAVVASTDAKLCESDLLFVVDGVAFCIEVKAGSITSKARGGNATRLATDLEKTLRDGSNQSDRLAQLIAANAGVWTQERKWIDLADVQEIHSIIVMLDDMGPLSLSMDALANQGIIRTEFLPWVVSLHDLIVLTQTLTHPAHLLEYVRRRRGRRLATMVKGVDELDLFMWFLNGGMYFVQDPAETSAQLPLSLPPAEDDVERFQNQLPVHVGTLTDPLDAWFYWREGIADAPAARPRREEARWVVDFLTASQANRAPGWLRMGADLVGLSGQAQEHFGEGLAQQLEASRGGCIERSLTTHGTGPFGSWLLVASAVPDGATTSHLADYLAAKQYQTEASRAMLLLYRPEGSLYASHFQGRALERTAALDDEVAQAGLLSLEETFLYAPGLKQLSAPSTPATSVPHASAMKKHRRKQARKSRRANRRR